MKTTILLLSVFLVISANEPAFAQDPHFTQFYANPLYLNPAFAGSVNCPRLIMNYRNEWPAIQGTYVTTSASYDQYSHAVGGGLGVLAYNDRAGKGILNTNYLGGIYSYSANFGPDFSMKVGFQAGVMQKSIAWDRLTFGDQVDARAGFVKGSAEQAPENSSRSHPDFSAGVLAFSKRYFGGVAVHHLTQPDEGFLARESSPLPLKITGHAGAVIPIKNSEDVSISPNVIYQRQGEFEQLNLGVYLRKGPIVGGLWYRNQDSFILLVGIDTGPLKLGYSYDVTVSTLANVSAGSHELSCAYRFKCKKKVRRYVLDSCPHF